MKYSRYCGFDGILGLKKKNGFYLALGISLSFYGPGLLFVVLSHFGQEVNAVLTGAVIALPLFFVILLLGLKECWRVVNRNSFVLFFMFFVWVAWYVIHALDVSGMVVVSDYDNKRPIFFLLGPVLMAFMGVAAYQYREFFVRQFYLISAVLSFLLSVLYVMLYDPGGFEGRVGGVAGLQIGLLLAQGVISFVVLYFFSRNLLACYALALPVLAYGILLSGTRATLVVAGVVFFYLLLISRFLSIGERKVFLRRFFPIIFVFFVAIVLAVSFGPEQSLYRITLFEYTGNDDRLQLVKTGLDFFTDHWWGQTAGFSIVWPDELEYVHNTIVQVFVEIGVFGGFFFAALLVFAMIGFFCSIKDKSVFLLSFNALSVAILSLSAGHAYFAQFWLVLSFFAAHGSLSVFKAVSSRMS